MGDPSANTVMGDTLKSGHGFDEQVAPSPNRGSQRRTIASFEPMPMPIRTRSSRVGSLDAVGSSFAPQRSARASFVSGHKADDPPTRQQMVRYLAMLEWAHRGCCRAPLPIALWFLLVILLTTSAHTETSYLISRSMTDYVKSITADESRGVPPDRIYSEAVSDTYPGVECTCACSVERNHAMCTNESEDRSLWFNESLNLRMLALLRNRAQFNASKKTPKTVRWDDIDTLSDVWFWIQHGLLPEIWHEIPLSSPVVWEELVNETSRSDEKNVAKRGVILRWDQFIHGIRMRTYRLKTQLCTIDNRITDRYNKRCHDTQILMEPYGPGQQSYIEGFIPEDTKRAQGAFDVHLDFAYDITKASEQIEHVLKPHSWLDQSSQSLAIQAAFINAQADPPLLGTLRILFDFERSGGLSSSIHIHTVSAVPYTDGTQWLLMSIWFVLILILAVWQIFKLVTYFCSTSKKRMSSCDMWDIGNWATIVTSCGLAANFNLLSWTIGETSDKVASLPSAPRPDEASTNRLRLYHEEWDQALDQVIDLTSWGEYNRILLFWYTLLLTFQFLQVFRGQPKLAELAQVLLNAGEDLVHFGTLFLVFFFNFAFGGFMIFGLYLKQWSGGFRSINSSLRVLMGQLDLAEMYEVAPLSTCVWFCFFITCMMFLMLNLLLAIACDNYRIVKLEGGTYTGIFVQASFAIRDVWKRGCCSCCCSCPCGRRCPCRRRSNHRNLVSISELSREMTSRCRFSDSEYRQLQASVIHPQRIRRKKERQAFAAETDDADEILQLRQKYAIGDLKQMGLDPNYAQDLSSDCRKYIDSEYDFEEQRQSQLREIVAIAYDELVVMRSRLSECSIYVCSETSGLGARVRSLEGVVHESLEKITQIAGGANLQTKATGAGLNSKRRLDTTVNSMRSLSPRSKSTTKAVGDLSSTLKSLNSDGMPKATEMANKKNDDVVSTLARARREAKKGVVKEPGKPLRL